MLLSSVFAPDTAVWPYHAPTCLVSPGRAESQTRRREGTEDQSLIVSHLSKLQLCWLGFLPVFARAKEKMEKKKEQQKRRTLLREPNIVVHLLRIQGTSGEALCLHSFGEAARTGSPSLRAAHCSRLNWPQASLKSHVLFYPKVSGIVIFLWS